jgi:ribonuclease Z
MGVEIIKERRGLMTQRELVILGTSAQVPTRSRNHNGYLLRWDDEAILFDPGEGTQRQLLLADVSSASITAICITHLHGDHCLGLPGVLARFALDRRSDPVDLYFPAAGAEYVERLRQAAVFDGWPGLRVHPLAAAHAVIDRGSLRLVAAPLEHSIDTLGWRVEEPDGRRLLPERLAALGIDGVDIGRLVRTGRLDRPDGRVTLDVVSIPRPGQRFAFIMDTSPCDSALMLADHADLVVCESTFLDADVDLAHRYRHSTARQAAWIATEARARCLVLTHFSQRYDDDRVFGDEAKAVFPDVVVARDLMTVPVPPRGQAPGVSCGTLAPVARCADHRRWRRE